MFHTTLPELIAQFWASFNAYKVSSKDLSLEAEISNSNGS